MGHVSLRARRFRSGVSILEIAIVVAIIGILAAVGAMLMSGTLPSWRTRQGAYDFAAVLNLAKTKAINDGVEYRVRIVSTDPTLEDETGNIGVYTLEKGNLASASDTWDVLPEDGNGPDTLEGTYDISITGDEKLRDVSISLAGTPMADGNDIRFSPRGWLANEDGDFDSSGYISVIFVNKRARINGEVDDRVVQISRAGMVRVVNGASAFPTGTMGTTAVSNTTASTGSGYAPP